MAQRISDPPPLPPPVPPLPLPVLVPPWPLRRCDFVPFRPWFVVPLPVPLPDVEPVSEPEPPVVEPLPVPRS
jgi:hypothetical protein